MFDTRLPLLTSAIQSTSSTRGDSFSLSLEYYRVCFHIFRTSLSCRPHVDVSLRSQAHEFCASGRVDTTGRFTVFGQAFQAIHSMPVERLRRSGQLYRFDAVVLCVFAVVSLIVCLHTAVCRIPAPSTFTTV